MSLSNVSNSLTFIGYNELKPSATITTRKRSIQRAQSLVEETMAPIIILPLLDAICLSNSTVILHAKGKIYSFKYSLIFYEKPFMFNMCD